VLEVMGAIIGSYLVIVVLYGAHAFWTKMSRQASLLERRTHRKSLGLQWPLFLYRAIHDKLVGDPQGLP
jgi:hypothetical protein